MFEMLKDPTEAQIDTVVDALYSADTIVAISVDPRGVWVVVVALPDPPYAVSFACVSDLETMAPQQMGLDDRKRIEAWSQRALPKIMRRWRQRYPESAFALYN